MQDSNTLQSLKKITDIDIGLTLQEVASAPKNIPTHHVSRTELALTVLKNQLLSFFFVLLIVSGVLSIFLGETINALIFFVIAGINTLIGFIQEFHANQSVQALEKLITHTVTVRREGELQAIESVAVVEGDIVICEPGDVIVADMLVRTATDLFLNESVRTGESTPRLVYEGEVVFAGASVTEGTLVGQVVSVGKKSSILMYAEKISKIAKSNNFEKFIHKISLYLVLFTTLCLLLIFVVNVLIVHSFTIPDYILYAISMLVGVVPESLPLIITIILSREVLSLAKEQVIVKKLSILQNLGGMNYLFTDKTGTITENNLHIKQLIDEKDLVSVLDIIASGEYERTPMDQVFDTAIEKYLEQNSTAGSKIKKEKLVFSPFQIKRGYSIYTLPSGGEIIRGQYKNIAEMCGDEQDSFFNKCLSLEEQGLRLIAFAHKDQNRGQYKLSGVAVFEDPLKSDAVEIYNNIENLGVDVKMITGDSLAVATYIGEALESDFSKDKIFSMDMWNNSVRNITNYEIYARCTPDHKSLIIDKHLATGVVGFLGDGINDALALKRADIGFVVDNASDVARQSSDVILMEKSLNPLVQAIALSRKAFFHIRTYLLCTLTGNIGTLVSLTAVVLVWKQIPMLPVQILLNNLLTDVPLMFVITDNISSSSLVKPIRDQAKTFFTIIFVYATLSSLFDFIFFFFFYHYDISILRTGWFVFSVLSELALVFSLRSALPLLKAPKMSKILMSVLATCSLFAVILPFTPLGRLFSLYPLTVPQMSVIFGIIVFYIVSNEIVKKYLFKNI